MNFNFETIGNKYSSAHDLLPIKDPILFFPFHGQKCRQNFEPTKTVDIIFGHETKKSIGSFIDKSSCTLEYLLPIVSKLKFINLERIYCTFSIFKQ